MCERVRAQHVHMDPSVHVSVMLMYADDLL